MRLQPPHLHFRLSAVAEDVVAEYFEAEEEDSISEAVDVDVAEDEDDIAFPTTTDGLTRERQTCLFASGAASKGILSAIAQNHRRVLSIVVVAVAVDEEDRKHMGN